ncbi:hypothetical protein EYC84_000517 [Monilinia fructicola]|uniref:Uncharacterized protein n=1 Tax=Monilinia fructicola TaxID=38448 RepID=A0A5M9JSY3_MONFR|nr:hypothetical protein EYC84_000517 [Monilinia fructicola]
MSSSAQGTPVPLAEDKKKGLSRVLGRMKTVLRRSDGSKRLSFTSKTSTAAKPSASKTAPTPKPIPTAELPKEAPAAIPAPVEAKQTTAPSSLQGETQSKPQSKPQPIKVSRAEINAERARKLGERFQLQIEPHEWQTLSGEKDAWRIEKPIRMRIHRTCHKCNTTYGANKICASCEHPRCTKCPRYPLKKKDKGKGKTALATSGPTPVEVDEEWKPEKLVLTLPRSGELVTNVRLYIQWAVKSVQPVHTLAVPIVPAIHPRKRNTPTVIPAINFPRQQLSLHVIFAIRRFHISTPQILLQVNKNVVAVSISNVTCVREHFLAKLFQNPIRRY